MYKLTYESDEDVLGQEEERNRRSDQTQKNEKETVIYDKSDLSHSQQIHWTPYPDYKAPNAEGRERSSTIQSTASASYAVVNKSKSKEAEANPDTRKKFYSLFYNESPEDTPTKEEEEAKATNSGCKWCILIVYLLLLTAATAVLFVNFHQLQHEHYILKQRLDYLIKFSKNNKAGKNYFVLPTQTRENYYPRTEREENSPDDSSETRNQKLYNYLSLSPDSNFFDLPIAEITSDVDKDSGGENVPISQHQQYNQNETGFCCKNLRQWHLSLRSKVLQNLRTIQGSRQRSIHFFTATEERMSSLQRKIENLEATATSSTEAQKVMELSMMKTKNEVESIRGTMAEHSEKDPTGNGYPSGNVAFSASRAVEDITIVDSDGNPAQDFINVKTGMSSIRATLTYESESINMKEDMDPSTGTFTVPSDGLYVFHIAFCTEANSSVDTTVNLMADTTSLRSFRVPILSPLSRGFAINLNTPPIPISARTARNGRTDFNIYQHNYSDIFKLQAGQKVILQLLSGSIVDLRSRSGEEKQSCTRFSGHRLM